MQMARRKKVKPGSCLMEVILSHSKNLPYCNGGSFCTCHSGYLEPDEYCPKHGSLNGNKCVQCGRFYSLENPSTCLKGEE